MPRRLPRTCPARVRLLELPGPSVDELGRPTWPCTPGDVSKAYRRLSILVHPDKNPDDQARVAFEALNTAHRMLRNPGQLVRGQASFTNVPMLLAR
jgi:DnaJ domain